jgi:hypothetical protein
MASRQVFKLYRKYTRIADNGRAGSAQTRIPLSDAGCALTSCIEEASAPRATGTYVIQTIGALVPATAHDTLRIMTDAR